ncbi:MAG: YIP1 family protein, partial [Clostridia bacterium]|nr:YIP1 family protein [Clostridia bacterium]
GEMEGAFKQISSLVVYVNTVYVLDQQLGTVTAFTPTEYGRLILQAMENYSEGRFAQAQETWKTLLERNANLELAYSGMGEALLKSGEYREAMTYFRQGNNPERESVAFSKYRAQLIRDNPVAVSVVLLVLLAGVLFLSRRAFWVKRRQRAKLAAEKQRSYVGDMLYVCSQTLSHPVTTLTERKYKRYRSWPLVGGILLWWFLVGVLSHELTGFRFSGGNEDLNIFLELLFSVIPFALFCVSNWACCSILDGEGRFDEICTFTALGMLPNLLIQTLAIPLSNVLCLTEQDFYNWFLLFGVLWSAFLLFQAIRITQQYSTGKTILMILLSLAGIVIILFLLLLVVALVQQIYSFVMTLVSELSYKG